MKELVYLLFLCLLSSQVFAQNYSIEKNRMDDIVAGYAEEIIQTNTPIDSRHYAFTLIQNDKEFVVSCTVTPDSINVIEQTSDMWNEMEATIVRAINKVKQSLASNQTQPTTSVNLVSQESFHQITEQNNATVITRPVTQQTTSNNTNVNSNPQMDFYGNLGYVQSPSYTLEDVRNGKATIGGKIWFSDGSYGIIFFLDGMGHGLAVSLDETETKWQNAKKEKYCQDIYQLVNESEPSRYCNGGLGAQQTQMIINQLGWGQAPAAEWCLRHGDGWYLPSAGELWYLFTVANYCTNNVGDGKKTSPQDGFISKMLQTSGGQPIDSYWYWSSSEEEQESAWNVSASGRYSSEDKINEVAVRAVRSF